MSKSAVFISPALESTSEMPIDDTRYFIRFSLNGKINVGELKKMAGLAAEETTSDETVSEGASDEDFY